MESLYSEAADIIKKSKHIIALTGAGISVESGIPDFRSSGGLWEKYDPSIYAAIESFYSVPEKVWEMIFDMMEIVMAARPNPAHIALAELERAGYLKSVITQNVDNLHQEAGSRDVIEYHGNYSKLQCMECGSEYDAGEYNISEKVIPRCESCGKILKPSVVFFGEMIPRQVLVGSQEHAEKADAVIIVGTSAVVYPAAGIPYTASRNGASVIEFNMEKTPFTGNITDVFIQGPAGVHLPKVLELLKN